MLINCPYCGLRDLSEFTYQGDATRTRPEPASTDQAAWNAWVYERPNTAGWHREFWQHSGGCRAHLDVRRNTVTHEIAEVSFARESATTPVKPVDGARGARPSTAKSEKPAARKSRTPRRKPAGTKPNGAGK